MLDPVLPDALDLEHPCELTKASRKWAGEITTEAARHGISLTQAGVVECLRSAATEGYVRAALVSIPDVRDSVLVVEASDVLPGMRSFLVALASGAVSVSCRALTPDPVRPTSRRRGPLRRALRAPALRVFTRRSPARSPLTFFRHARSSSFAAMQHEAEIVQLLELAATLHPRAVLEIGTARGGTTCLLSRVSAADAVIVTCDLRPRVDADELRQQMRRGQQLHVLALDSHSSEGRARAFACLPAGTDVLFIDGDHTYTGARSDLLTYASLVRSRGLIVLHDIVEDYATRYGIETSSSVGGVPQLWREVRASAPAGFRIHEFVENWAQDGFGIGVVECPPVDSPGDALVARISGR